jgi:S1-C subfamily serine protease
VWLILGLGSWLAGGGAADLPAEEPAAPSLSAEDWSAIRAAEQARIQAIEQVSGTVVAIYGNDRQGGGSGVLFHPAGFALTNHHVVAAAGDEGWAGLADGRLYRWQLLGTDPGGDVAIIRLRGRTDFPAARLGNSDLVRVGDWALAMGNPFVLADDQRPTVTLGIVSGVRRYQPGDASNLLVYGNCLQVDSSINPGNSGGPLFNLHGEVVGINGRCSFEERGRVNVGLGYSISSNQARAFVPDLLATKTAQHGTLDCQFGDRTGGVVCQSLNLNAPIAQAGLQLGDRLVEFEGYPIEHANDFTNLVTVFPADWPCVIVFERPSGERKTVHVRLTPLPYKFPSPGQPRPAREPEERPPQPEEAPQRPPALPRAMKVPLVGGAVRFPELCAESTEWILKSARSTLQASASTEPTPPSIRVMEWRRQGDQTVGEIETLFASGRRFAVRERVAGKVVRATGFNGERFWRILADEHTADLAPAKALRDPLALQAVAMSTLWQASPHAAWGTIGLQGSDKAQQQTAARLALTQGDNEPAFLWFSLFAADGSPHIALLKTGIGLHHDEPLPALTYHQWRVAEEIAWPWKKESVRGLGEELHEEILTQSVARVELAQELFEMDKP